MTVLTRLFRDHPHSVDETYVEHMGVAFSFSLRLFKAAFCAFAHGIVPGVCETSASRAIRELHAEMANRHAPAGQPAGSSGGQVAVS